MRYVEFRDSIKQALINQPQGMTWKELKTTINLPYKQPCPEWIKQLEVDINLVRERCGGRAYIWKIKAQD